MIESAAQHSLNRQARRAERYKALRAQIREELPEVAAIRDPDLAEKREIALRLRDIAAEHGIVRIQAQTILPATPQRTAERRCIDPTPTMAPVMVCVVLTGIPSLAVKNNIAAAPVSAENP